MIVVNKEDLKQYELSTTRKSGEEAMKCPVCSDQRKKKNVKCFSWNHEKAVGHCSHCGATLYVPREKKEKEYAKPVPRLQTVSDAALSWFSGRGISNNTIIRFKITEAMEFMPQVGKERNCICFNYFKGGELINIKFRDGAKNFKLVKDAELSFYNVDEIEKDPDCVICEGEMDCLSFYEAGVYNCVSVPNGASKGSQRLEYLDNCYEYFLNKERVYLATDGDQAGISLRDELARRIGKERCWIVRYPEGCKDANEVLLRYGKAAVKQLLDDAYQYPVEGVERVLDIEDELMMLYNNGYPVGDKIGYTNLDSHISFRTEELTVITGTPGAGKSTWLNNVLVRLAARNDWRIAMFSPEKQPTAILTAELVEIFSGKMFFSHSSGKVSPSELHESKAFIQDHFWFTKIDEIEVTVDGILEKCKELVVRHGVKVLVIDPWNYVEHKIPPGKSETQYISEELTKIKRFKDRYGVHIFMIAHPTKIKTDKDGNFVVPTLYDISGSAHFFNKTDNGVVLHRDYQNNKTVVYIQKIRWSFVGKIGSVPFIYQPQSKRFFEEGGIQETEIEIYRKRAHKEVDLFDVDLADLPF